MRARVRWGSVRSVSEMRPEFVFIGPVCAGKSSVAELVAQRLGCPHVDLDDLRERYLGSVPGFDFERLRVARAQSQMAAVRYVEPAFVHSVERFLVDHHGCVFDFGAGHTCYVDPSHHGRVAEALRPFQRVVLLLPDADPARSVEVLRARCISERGEDWIFDGFDFIDYWVRNWQNERLATTTVITGERTPQEVADHLVPG